MKTEGLSSASNGAFKVAFISVYTALAWKEAEVGGNVESEWEHDGCEHFES